MKKKLLVTAFVVAMVLALALSIGAAEPDMTKETVTLSDSTVCALWDTDGKPLIWYIAGTDENGANIYEYVDATSDAVDYNGGYSATTDGVRWYQLSKVTINVDGTAYGKSDIVVINMRSDDVKIKSGQNVGQHVNCLSKVFTDAAKLEYVYLPLDTVDLNSENFKNCKALRYVNLSELTELREIGSQDFNIGEVKYFMENQVLDLSRTKLITLDVNGFACCSATEIILPSTLTSVGNDAFRSCRYATKITFNSTLTSLNTSSLFSGCNALEEIAGFNMPANVTSFGKYAFRYCYALKDAGDFIVNGVMRIPEGISTVSEFAFSDCRAITAIVFPSTISTINQQGFSYMTSVKVLDFSARDKAAREAAKNGTTLTFTLGNCGHFRDMDSLVAVSLPYGIEEVNNRAFANCDNLTAVYVPDTVKRFSSNGGGQGTFCDSKKFYFVDDSFEVSQCIGEDNTVDTTKLVLPEKPTVYFMPESLETFTGHSYSNDTWSNATVFQNCTSINDVLVFPESFTKMVTMRPFANMGTDASPKTIVFLGDIEQFVISHQNRQVRYVFANPNDTDFSKLGIVRTTTNGNEKGSYAYFCSTGKMHDLNISGRKSSGTDPTTEENATAIAETITALNAVGVEQNLHVANTNETIIEEANCVNNEKHTTFCFCGKKIGTSEIENTALGHNFDTENGASVVDIIYADFTKNGNKVILCGRENCGCHDIEVEGQQLVEVAPVISGFNGYSIKLDGNGITFGFNMNIDALNEYEEYNSKLEIGTVAAVKGYLNGQNPIDAEGNPVALEKGNVIKAQATDKGNIYTRIDFVLKGDIWNSSIEINEETVALKDLEFVMCPYVICDGVVSYISTQGSVENAGDIVATYSAIQNNNDIPIEE